MSFLYKYLPLCNDIDWTRKIPRDYGEAEKKQTGPGGEVREKGNPKRGRRGNGERKRKVNRYWQRGELRDKMIALREKEKERVSPLTAVVANHVREVRGRTSRAKGERGAKKGKEGKVRR